MQEFRIGQTIQRSDINNLPVGTKLIGNNHMVACEYKDGSRGRGIYPIYLSRGDSYIILSIPHNPSASNLPANTIFRQDDGIYVKLSHGIAKIVESEGGNILCWVSKEVGDAKLSRPYDAVVGQFEVNIS